MNIGSLAGKNPLPGGSPTTPPNSGLIGFTEALMADHRHDNIRTCCLMPGSVSHGLSPASGTAEWKIAAEDIAEIVVSVLAMPERTMISRVEVRPSRPKK